jgi:hypothetical protein
MSKWLSLLFCCSTVWANVNPGSVLPDLPEPLKDASLLPTQSGGLRFKGALDGTYFSFIQDFNSEAGAPLSLDLATRRIPATTLGWLVSAKPNHTETVMNMGWRFGRNQQLLFSTARLHELVDVSEQQSFDVNQLSAGLNYRYFLDKKWLSGVEWSSYLSSSPGQFGSQLYGMRVGMETTPLPDTALTLGVGTERLTYDGTNDSQAKTTAQVQWNHILFSTLRYNASLKTNGIERHLATGLDFNWRDGHQLGLQLARTQWKNSRNDGEAENAIKFAYTYQFGHQFVPFQTRANKAPWRSSLIPEVLERPGYLPDKVLAKPGAVLN